MAELVILKPPATPLGYVNNTQGWWGDTSEPTPELQWPACIAVQDAMRRQDSQVMSVLRAVGMPLRRAKWGIERGDAKASVTAHVAGDLGLPVIGGKTPRQRRSRDRFSWPDHVRHVLLELPFGHSIFEQQYVYDENELLHLKKLEWRPPGTIAKFNVARDGGLESIEQWPGKGDTGMIKIPITQLVAYVHEREGAQWQGQSILRSCYKNWLIKDQLIRTQALSIDRNGLGVPRYTGADGEVDLAKGLVIAKSWRAGMNAAAAIPATAKLDVVGVTGSVPDALPAIRYHDEQIARAVLAHVLNLGSQTGSWALGSTLMDFFAMSLQAEQDHIQDVTQRHVIDDLVDLAYGPDEPSPRLVCEEIGSNAAALAQALKVLVDAGIIRPDRDLEEFMRRALTLPAPTDDTEEAA